MATADGRATDELLALYALEGFLDRLSSSARADDLVIKGGVLLAARDTGCATRDIDVQATHLTSRSAKSGHAVSTTPQRGWEAECRQLLGTRQVSSGRR